ncbi:MAG: hypothetical protein NT030_07760, partial [Candidatus Saganbacteria bacterium]|nr:hypothetical protein [Candidatus Saganbacteria bacterium]
MTAFATVCILTTIAAFLAALFIIKNNPTRFVNQICSILNINIGLWTLGLGLLTIQSTRESALFWLRIHYIGAILIPVLFLHFIIALLNIKASRVLMIIFYAISLFFLFSNFAGLLCDVRPIL